MKVNHYLDLYPEFTKSTIYLCKDGRKRVRLYNPYTRRQKITQYARVLVEQKIGRRLENWETVDPIDNDKTNDSLENLQVLSRAENARKGSLGNKNCLGFKHSEETKQKNRGSKNGMSKLTESQVVEFRELFNSGKLSKKEIIVKTGLSAKTVYNFLSGKSYKQI